MIIWSDKIERVYNHPRPGITFYDICPVLQDKNLFMSLINQMSWAYKQPIEKVVGIESRGFILGAAIAEHIGAGFVPIRKEGKLPRTAYTTTYLTEYSKDSLQIHKDAISPGERILLVDDVLATGGTAAAARDLITYCGGDIKAMLFFLELLDLDGWKKVRTHNVVSICKV